MYYLFTTINNQSLSTISKKLLITFIITYILSVFIYNNYSNVKYWNVPSDYIKENGEILQLSDIFYYNIITWFTIGYGDFTPKHPRLKSIAILNGTIAYIIALL